jgi:hypothetical protein
MSLGPRLLTSVALGFVILTLLSCSSGKSAPSVNRPRIDLPPAKLEQAPVSKVPVIHVFVALADNVNQGIVPVSADLGNGDNPKTNLYWGAAYGVKTFFTKSKDWELISATPNTSAAVLERLVFKHRAVKLFLVADAYQGKQIAKATADFLDAASGVPGEKVMADNTELHTHGSAELVAYVGHNGLMDFKLSKSPQRRDTRERQAIILSCASKQYFSEPLKSTGANPMLWTTNLMAPEAYALSAAIDGWIAKESGEQIRERTARAYDKYQHCGLRASMKLFATGW